MIKDFKQSMAVLYFKILKSNQSNCFIYNEKYLSCEFFFDVCFILFDDDNDNDPHDIYYIFNIK